MIELADRGGTAGACASCLRRSWLLSALSGPLDCCAGDRGRLLELLGLDDADLLHALAGRRRAELMSRYEEFDAAASERGREVEALCHHDDRYPRALSGTAAPRMLNVAGGAERLARLTSAPVVAIVGSTRASDYGIEMARSLARGLAASGVTVAASLLDGIAATAHAGALAHGGTLAVMGGGLRVSPPARWRAMCECLTDAGCAVSELPCDCRGRRWGQPASERILARLAALVVVIEARDTPADLAVARLARALGVAVAALPGRVTSPLSAGTHSLLIGGASLVRGAQDVIEMLGPLGGARCTGDTTTAEHAELEPRLRTILDRVGAGGDTPDKLAGNDRDGGEVLLALSELELMGLLARGDGGRYVPCHPLPTAGNRPPHPGGDPTTGDDLTNGRARAALAPGRLETPSPKWMG